MFVQCHGWMCFNKLRISIKCCNKALNSSGTFSPLLMEYFFCQCHAGFVLNGHFLYWMTFLLGFPVVRPIRGFSHSRILLIWKRINGFKALQPKFFRLDLRKATHCFQTNLHNFILFLSKQLRCCVLYSPVVIFFPNLLFTDAPVSVRAIASTPAFHTGSLKGVSLLCPQS